MTDAIDTTAIKARLEAATKGPWQDDGNATGYLDQEATHAVYGPVMVDDNGWAIAVVLSDVDDLDAAANARLIAHAPSDLTALLLQHEQDQRRIGELEGALTAVNEITEWVEAKSKEWEESSQRDGTYSKEFRDVCSGSAGAASAIAIKLRKNIASKIRARTGESLPKKDESA